MIKPRNNILNIQEELSNNKLKRLIVRSIEEKIIYFYIINDRLVSFYVENPNIPHTGQCYTGIVNNIVKGINGFFVNISKDTSVYVPSKNNNEAIILNRNNNCRVVLGDHVIVRIKKEPTGDKRAVGQLLNLSNVDTYLPEKYREGISLPLYEKLTTHNSYINDFLNDIYDLSNCKCICQDENAFKYIKQNCNSNLFESIELYSNESITLNSLYSLERKYKQITEKKVWLKNGGYLFIEHTEAMTVIDVNSGKSSEQDKNDDFIKVNKEAAIEIVRQIESRNLSGIIIIDFINMKNNQNYNTLKDLLVNELAALNPPAYFVDFTKLGLAEITREKKMSSIYEMQHRLGYNLKLF